MTEISDLPMHHDIDADYTPQYVKLARILRSKIESGEYKRGDALPASGLAHKHRASVRVVWNALAMRPITDEGVAVGGAFASDTATGVDPGCAPRRRCAIVPVIVIHRQEVSPMNAVSAVGAPLPSTIARLR
jgi:hypothetical protein